MIGTDDIDCPTCQDSRIVPDGPHNPCGNVCPDCGGDNAIAQHLDAAALAHGGSTMTPVTLAWAIWDPT